MTEYARKALDRLQHPKPQIPQYAPHRWSAPVYGKRLQMVPNTDERNILDKNATKIILLIVGNMLYYAWLVYPTMLRAINENLQVQSRPSRDTSEKEKMLLDYAATYPNAILQCKASDMLLHVD